MHCSVKLKASKAPAMPKIHREVWNIRAEGILCTLNSRWLDGTEDTDKPQHAQADSAAGCLHIGSESCLQKPGSNARWSPTFSIELHYPPSGNWVKTSCLTVKVSISEILSSKLHYKTRQLSRNPAWNNLLWKSPMQSLFEHRASENAHSE